MLLRSELDVQKAGKTQGARGYPRDRRVLGHLYRKQVKAVEEVAADCR